MSKEEYLNYLYTKQASLAADVEKLNKEYRELWNQYHAVSTDAERKGLKAELWNKYHELTDKNSELEIINDEISKTRVEIAESKKHAKENPEDKEVVKEKKHGGLAALGIAALAIATGVTGYAIGRDNNCAGRIVEVQSDDLDHTETPVITEAPTSTPEVTATPVVTEEPTVEPTPVVTEAPTATPAPTEAPTATPEPTATPYAPFGHFTDPSDPEMLEERANWYFDEYFSKFDSDKLEKSGITRESLIDIMSVFNGKLPVDGNFEVNELLNYNNQAVKAFVNFPSSWNDVKGGQRMFIPTQYLFRDGSYEQKCAAEVDELMEKIITAMNEEDYATFYENTVKFGELMRDQYYLVDNNTDHYTVRSVASFPSRIQLYGLAYANWADNINEFQISREIDVCVPFCFDHETKEMTEIPLANLMATLEYIPMGEWDAVLQRAGITPEEIANLGNSAVEDPMPVVFTRDAKNHFRELIREKEEQKALKLG